MPTELELGSPQVCNYQEDKSEDARVDDLHSLEEAALFGRQGTTKAYVATTIKIYNIMSLL
jgi:hypothetical protein